MFAVNPVHLHFHLNCCETASPSCRGLLGLDFSWCAIFRIVRIRRDRGIYSLHNRGIPLPLATPFRRTFTYEHSKNLTCLIFGFLSSPPYRRFAHAPAPNRAPTPAVNPRASANSIGIAVFIGFKRVNLKAAVRQFVDGAFKNRELARVLFLDTALDPFKRFAWRFRDP